MKKVIMVSMILFVSSFLFSYEYIMNSSPNVMGYYPGATHITTLSSGDWDSGHYDLAIPSAHQFYYYGKLVTHLRITTNGYVCLGIGSASGVDFYTGMAIPNGSSANVVAPLMDDYSLAGDSGGAGELWYEFYTNGSYRYTAVEWKGVRVDGTASTDYTFECLFYSSTHPNFANMILFSYSDVYEGDAAHDYGATASVGIQNSTGTVGERYSNDEAIVASSQRILFTPFVPVYGSTVDLASPVDLHPDAIIFRPSVGKWYFYNSDGSTNSLSWGTKGDVALPGDWDGDGDSDNCVFRPSNNMWYCQVPDFSAQWGTAGDIPVPADYNGDGVMDIAVFRPTNGYWYISLTGSGTQYSTAWGQQGDIPLPADYDGDFIADLAVFRPTNSTWFIRKSSDLSGVAKQWGADGDFPLPGNYNCTSYVTPAVFRPSSGYWYYFEDSSYTTAYSTQWGQDGDVPVPGDENLGCATDPTVFRPGNGYWFLKTHSYLPASFQWGSLGDKPRFRRSTQIVSPPPTSGVPDFQN